jgi:hypothetical protein
VRNLIQAGVGQAVAMAISGHEREAMFRRYNITSEEDLRDAARRLTVYLSALPSTHLVRPIDSKASLGLASVRVDSIVS